MAPRLRCRCKLFLFLCVQTNSNLVTIVRLTNNHRLNGVNGDFSFLWWSQKFDPHRIKTPDRIKIKFGTVDSVGEATCHAKFYANPSKGGFSANGWNIRKNVIYICFFSSTHPQVRPLKGFLRWIGQTTRFCTRKCLLGLENKNLIFNVFIRKNQKNAMAPMGKIKQFFKRS